MTKMYKQSYSEYEFPKFVPSEYFKKAEDLKFLSFPEEAPPTRWRVCIDNPFPNCDKIYPIQQRKVAQILSDLKEDTNVKKVVIFGSSTTARCHIGSDVDFYVELEEKRKVRLSAFDFLYDLWTNYTVEPEMLSEINKKGVIVYER